MLELQASIAMCGIALSLAIALFVCLFVCLLRGDIKVSGEVIQELSSSGAGVILHPSLRLQ